MELLIQRTARKIWTISDDKCLTSVIVHYVLKPKSKEKWGIYLVAGHEQIAEWQNWMGQMSASVVGLGWK